MFAETITWYAAFFAGIISFFSPCVLPLIPAYFTFITGLSLDELTGDQNRETRIKVIISTIAYIAGFSTVFVILGASASLAGGVIEEYRDIIRIVGGIVIIIFGIHLTGLLQIPGLHFEKRIHMNKKPLHIFGTFLIGMAFGAGWSPCIGPLLGSILIIASNQETVWHGIGLLSLFSAGMAIPFLLISVFINYILVFLKRMSKVIKYINMVAGVLLILLGVALVANKMIFI